MNTYFRKELLRNRVLDANKQPVQWEPIGNDAGVKVVDDVADKATFDLLEGLASKRRMGVTRISSAIMESLKKNPQPSRASLSASSVGQQIRVFNKEAVLPKHAQEPVGAPPVGNVGETQSQRQLTYEEVQALKLQQAQASTPSLPPVPLTAKQRMFQPRTKKQSETKAAIKTAPAEQPKAL